jgi:amyloid beta precursor protein binding protein 1
MRLSHITWCVLPEFSCRYGNGSVHNIASFMGGVVSQEIIKLITHQYIPMDNTFIFDGTRSVSGVFAV